jgi:hypothetical protein
LIYQSYTQNLKIKNINYIKNILAIYYDSDETISTNYNIILKSIDNKELNIFPEIYNISDYKKIFVFNDKLLKGYIINSDIVFFITTDIGTLELKRLS